MVIRFTNLLFLVSASTSPHLEPQVPPRIDQPYHNHRQPEDLCDVLSCRDVLLSYLPAHRTGKCSYGNYRHAVPHPEDEEHHASGKGRHIQEDEPDEHGKDQRHGAWGPAQGKEYAQSESADEGRVPEEAHREMNQPLRDSLLFRHGFSREGIRVASAQRETRAHRLYDLADGLDDIYAQNDHQHSCSQIKETGLANEDADV